MSNFLKTRQYPGYTTKRLDRIVKDKPIETEILPDIPPVKYPANSLAVPREDAENPLMKSLRGTYSFGDKSAIPVMQPQAATIPSVPAQDFSAFEEEDLATVGAPDTTPTNALTTDYWKRPVIGNVPLDKFVQLTGMTAHALDPEGFGGRLGKSLAGMATRERGEGAQARREESTNKLRELQIKKAKLDLEQSTIAADPSSSANRLKQIKLNREQLALDREHAARTSEMIADVDLTVDRNAHASAVSRLAESGADVSQIPSTQSFIDAETGKVDQKKYKLWQDNFISTAKEKAKWSREEQKKRFTTITLYNKKTDEEIEWAYEKAKQAGAVFNVKETSLGKDWSQTKPTATTEPAPTAYRTFYESGIAAGKTKAQLDTEWTERKKLDKLAKDETWTFIGTNEDTGVPMVMNKKGVSKPMEGVTALGPKGGAKGISAEKLADIESKYILGKLEDGTEFGATPAAAPYITLYNQNATGNYIYRAEDVPTTTWYGGATTERKLNKVPLPMIDGQQVTGKEIADTAKQSKGKYTFDQVLQMVLERGATK
uniref:Uncharacterized protein n=1 Tax=viral metagenome TaxID=1070528 RepID=A0A6H1ZNT0_9ZZZZ